MELLYWHCAEHQTGRRWGFSPVWSAQQSESHLTGADAGGLQPALEGQAPPLRRRQQTLVELVRDAGDHQARICKGETESTLTLSYARDENIFPFYQTSASRRWPLPGASWYRYSSGRIEMIYYCKGEGAASSSSWPGGIFSISSPDFFCLVFCCRLLQQREDHAAGWRMTLTAEYIKTMCVCVHTCTAAPVSQQLVVRDWGGQHGGLHGGNSVVTIK